MNQPLDYDIAFGRMDSPGQEERAKRLYKQLEKIQRDWSIISPGPEFKMTVDRHKQIHIRMNQRMLVYMLMGYSDIVEETLQQVEPEEPPEWFMKLMGGE